MYILLMIIFVHEMGHYIFAILTNVKISKITIYPFGGITIFDSDLNISIVKELFVLLGGIFFQMIFFLLINKIHLYGYITNHVYKIIKNINYILISFNFLPIIPLDGGKLINIIFDVIFSYKTSIKLSLFISVIFSIVFLLLKKSTPALILFLFLIKEINIEYNNIEHKYNKFLLERYLNEYKFKKIKKIKDKERFKREYYHIVNNEFEEKVLYKIFNMV